MEQLARLRWRLRGAWLWPSFLALSLLDALIGHRYPPVGDSQSATSAWLVAMFFNILAVLLIAPAIGALIRRRRHDLPKVVARDYAGTAAISIVTAGILALGLIHHSTIAADQTALERAIAKGQSYIGAHAPAEFRRNIFQTSTYVIEPGSVFRICVQGLTDKRTYCVVVKARGVTFDGYEPNATFAQQAW